MNSIDDARIARAAKNYLSYRAFYKELCRNSSDMPKAEGGRIPVYLPEEAPWVVLKEAGFASAASRHANSKLLRGLLRTLNCAHIIVPRSRLIDGFVVEDRLPVNVHQAYNCRLYASDPLLFETAAREMVRLFSRVTVRDIVMADLKYPKNPLLTFAMRNGLKYHNFPLYIAKNEGRVGLIDTEDVEEKPARLSQLARIFPRNLSAMIDEAEKNLLDSEALFLEMQIQSYVDALPPATCRAINPTQERIDLLMKKIEIYLVYNAFGTDTIPLRMLKQEIQENPAASLDEILTGESRIFFRGYINEVLKAIKMAPEVYQIIVDSLNQCLRQGSKWEEELRLDPLVLIKQKETVAAHAHEMRRGVRIKFKHEALFEKLEAYLKENGVKQHFHFKKYLIFDEFIGTLIGHEIIHFESSIVKEDGKYCQIHQ